MRETDWTETPEISKSPRHKRLKLWHYAVILGATLQVIADLCQVLNLSIYHL